MEKWTEVRRRVLTGELSKRTACREHGINWRPDGGLKWLTPAAFVAGLEDTASGAVPAASRGVSPVGPAPLPPTHHADCFPTLS